MHHVIGYHLARARIADLGHDAQRATLARAVLASALRVLRRIRAVPGTAQAAQAAVAGGAPAR